MESIMMMTFDFVQLGELSLYQSLQTTRSYYGVGSFQLVISPDAPNASSLETGVLLFLASDPSHVMVVEDLTETTHQWTVVGTQLKGIAKRRIIVPSLVSSDDEYNHFGWDRYTGTAEDAYLHYAVGNLIDPEDEKRAIPTLIASESQGRGSSLPWQARFTKLTDLFADIGQTTGIGWDIVPDFDNKNYVFTILEGTDFSADDHLNAVVLSEEMGNVTNLTRRRNVSGSATTVYVGGAGEDENRLILSRGNETSGMERREMWSEAGSVDDLDMLQLFGDNKLTSYQATDALTADMLTRGICHYGVDYGLGDVITLTGLSVETDTRITEVTEIYENGAKSVKCVFGSSQVTAGGVLSRMTQSTVR